MSAERNCIARLGPLQFPRVGLVQPVFGMLNLASAFELLPEKAVLIADALAVSGAGER